MGWWFYALCEREAEIEYYASGCPVYTADFVCMILVNGLQPRIGNLGRKYQSCPYHSIIAPAQTRILPDDAYLHHVSPVGEIYPLLATAVQVLRISYRLRRYHARVRKPITATLHR